MGSNLANVFVDVESQKVLSIAVCTTGKNDVSRSLKSISDQTVSGGWFLLETVVIINQEVLDSEFAASLSREFPSVRLVHEPRIGIPFARNRAVKEVLGMGAGWLAFLDDDCSADKDWLFHLTLAASEMKADCVMGEVEYQPSGVPSDFIPKSLWGIPYFESEGLRDGQELRTAYTHSVLFKPILDPQTFSPLEFDVQRRNTGGSDAAYFSKFHELGGEIRFSRNAEVVELYSQERTRLKWHFLRRLRIGNRLKRQGILRGLRKGGVIRHGASKYLSYFLRLLVAIIFVPLVAIPALVMPSKWLRGLLGFMLLTLATPVGIALFALGITYEEYASTFVWTNPLQKNKCETASRANTG
jgi:succinoglycan biosynthesis protein ExoM